MKTYVALPSSQHRTLNETVPVFVRSWLLRRATPDPKIIILRSDLAGIDVGDEGTVLHLEGYRADSYHNWVVLAAFHGKEKTSGHPGSMDEMHQFYTLEDR